jgi:hypothetical protein
VDPTPLKVTRAQILAHRVRATGLDRPGGARGGAGKAGPAGLPVLDIGIQDTPPGGHRLHLANRLGAPLDDGAFDDGTLALAWSWRGAPHVQRPDDLARLACALWPLSDEDASNRLGSGTIKQVKASELSPLDAYRLTAAAIAEIVTKPTDKGTLSGQVTKAIPDELSAYCRGCDVVHISESLFRACALPAGLRIVPGAKPLTFEPIPGWRAASAAPDPAATAELARTYLSVLGPGTQGEAATFVGTTKADLADIWPDGLVQIDAGGRKAWFPDEDIDELRGAPPPDLVRFLGAFDPFLQGRDRPILVPDKAHRQELWKILGNPGGVLVDGQVVGTWRAKPSGKKVTITVLPFTRIPKKAQSALEDEAQLVAAARGAASASVAFGS